MLPCQLARLSPPFPRRSPRCHPPSQGDDMVQRLLPLLPRLGAAPSDLLAVNFGGQAGWRGLM